MKFDELERIIDYCMGKPCAYESRPFGPELACFRVSGRIFCQLSLKEKWFKATLKTNPETAEYYRMAYPGIIVRGYHCPPVQQPYWNTADLNEISFELMAKMIDEAYDEVVARLSSKERSRIPKKSGLRYVKCDGKQSDFLKMCEKLDANLEQLVGGKFDRTQYAEFNLTEKISDAIVIYDGDTPAGSGAYRFYDEETIEIKRIFVDPAYRGLGLGKELLLRLEADARIKGFRFAILETGELLAASVTMYKKCGYQIMENYGPYAGMKNSLCMTKKL